MKLAINHILSTAAALAISQGAFSAELHKVKMSDTVSVDGKGLVLNGLGAREATIFKVKVYIAGLYLEAPSKDPASILSSPQLKKLQMHFVHDVGAGKLKGAFEEGIQKNCKPGCEQLQEPLKKLNSLITDVKDGDELSFTFYPDKVSVVANNGQNKSLIDSALFSKTLLSIWLGDDPPNESLKAGLLGNSKH